MITYQGIKDFFDVSVLTKDPEREDGSLYIGLFSWPDKTFGHGCFLTSPGTWSPSTDFSVGDLISHEVNSHSYVYECIEAGTSGDVPPDFRDELGYVVFDNSVIWECVGCIFEECGNQPNSNYSRIALIPSEWFLVDRLNSAVSYLFYIGFEINYEEPTIWGYFLSNLSTRSEGKLLMYEVFSDGPYSANNDVIVIRLNMPLLAP